MYMSESALLWLLEGVSERNFHFADTGEDIDKSTLVPRGDLEITEALRTAWEGYESVLRIALTEWLTVPANFSGLSEDSAADMVERLMTSHDAPLDVFMTLNGEGVGIWDGRWEDLFSEAQIESLTKHLRGRLSDFANDSGSGTVNDALDTATYSNASYGVGTESESYD